MTLLKSSILAILVVLLLGLPSLAQETEKVDRKQIEFLLEIFQPDEIIASLDHDDIVIEITEVDLRFMEKRKVDTKLVSWLRQRIKKNETPITAQSLLEHFTAHEDAKALLKMIAKSKKAIVLSPQETIAMMKAGVPTEVLKAIRSTRDAKSVKVHAKKMLTLDAVLLMANNGKSTEEILAEVDATNSTFEISPEQALQLKKDGLDWELIQELYKRQKPTKKKSVVDPVKTVAAPGKTKDVEADDEFNLELLKDSATGITMLKPDSFVVSNEFNASKALVQMVVPSENSKNELPDLEISVMVVRLRSKDNKTINSANLEPIAGKFVQGLKDQFARENIRFTSEKPQITWIANRRALRIKTQAQVMKTKAGYEGASHIFHLDGRLFVVSYSMRLEKTHQWRGVMENCVRSITIKDAPLSPFNFDAPTRRDQLELVFDAWRKSIRHVDFATYRALHYKMEDNVTTRLKFLGQANAINENGKRVEIAGVDFDANVVNYNVFSVEGKSSHKLGFAKNKAKWILTGDRTN